MFIKKNYSSIKEKVTRIKWLTFIFIFFEKSTILILHDKIWLSFDKHSGKIRKPGT